MPFGFKDLDIIPGPFEPFQDRNEAVTTAASIVIAPLFGAGLVAHGIFGGIANVLATVTSTVTCGMIPDSEENPTPCDYLKKTFSYLNEFLVGLGIIAFGSAYAILSLITRTGCTMMSHLENNNNSYRPS